MAGFLENSISAVASPVPSDISGTYPHIGLSGRFHASASGSLHCAWPGSQVTLRFHGTGLQATIRDWSGDCEGDHLAILLDDAPPTTLALKPGSHTYEIAVNLAEGEHTVSLFKQTEASVGHIEYEGFSFRGGTILPSPPNSSRRIEYIGDSITCGYGNTAASEEESFKPSTENHYLSYGRLTARTLNADCHVIAWSGEGILRNAAGDVVHPIPSMIGQILPPTDKPAWNFAQWMPQVVVIHAGTNDFATGIPDREAFIDTYYALVEKLYRLYCFPYIFCCLSPMLTDESPKGENHRTVARSYLHEIKDRAEKDGIQSLHLLEFKTLQSGEFGADGHPNLAAHRRMAKTLTEAIRQETGWQERKE